MVGTTRDLKEMATMRKIASTVSMVTMVISRPKPFFISLYITDSPTV